MLKKIIIRSLFFCFFLNLAVTGHAQLMMEESRVELNVTPGQTVQDTMAIINTSNKPVDVKIYWQDFMYIAPFNGKKEFLPPGSTKYSMADWINFTPGRVTISPNSKRQINYVIKVPETAQGGYYGVLFFEQDAGEMQGAKAIRIVTRLGSLFFVKTVNSDKTSSIDKITVSGKNIQGEISNHGDVFLFPKGVYYVLNSRGMVSDRGEMQKIYLPPDKTAQFAVALPENLPGDTYTMVMTFDLDDGDSLVKEVDFVKNSDATLVIKAVRD